MHNHALSILRSRPGKRLLFNDFRELHNGRAPLTADVSAADVALLRFRRRELGS